jgi:hypothetical protein
MAGAGRPSVIFIFPDRHPAPGAGPGVAIEFVTLLIPLNHGTRATGRDDLAPRIAQIDAPCRAHNGHNSDDEGWLSCGAATLICINASRRLHV